MTAAKPNGEQEGGARPAGWDEALLVWNGIVTTIQRGAATARRAAAHERATDPSTTVTPAQQGRKEAT